ncbi:uncharacterized protein [Argopecten irradians]|uniref:uncharacterized protein n=1 Tax=Argopecten irradians TaxID=31199 RepID=UPI003724800D
MSKSESCVALQDSRQSSNLPEEGEKPEVTGTGYYQIKQSQGDVSSSDCLTVYGEQFDQIKGITHLNSKPAQGQYNNIPVSPETGDNKEIVINNVGSTTNEGHDKTDLVRHIGVPTKAPTSRPSPGRPRPTCPPCAVRINGKWVNLNKQPNIFVRTKERVAKIFRRLNRWYDETMLDIVVLHAKNQAHRRQEEGFRQQGV